MGPGSEHGSEPREFAIGAAAPNSKPDIVLLIHDRVLIYRQE